ncbi:phage tail length tape measure family protein [Paracidovorax wautersii]|uniref:phage tail length tape measure family protein n=1 Tax=Paracidovorax wautersii TaxID=1177982 RepID=UPI0031D504DA
MKDIEVGLRVKPLLDQAIAGLRQLRGEAQEAAKAGQAAQKAAATPPASAPAPARPAPAPGPAPTPSAAPPSSAPPAPAPARPATTTPASEPSKQVADEAARAAAELQREQRALDQLVGSLGPAASGAERLAGVQQQLDAALSKGLLTQEKHAALLGLAKDRYDEDAAALRQLTGELAPASTGAEKLAAAQQTLNTALAAGKINQAEHAQLMATAQQRYSQFGVTAGQTAQAMRQLPAQITDIATSLASGMPAWLVTIQQGGQIRDSFGSMSGAAVGLIRTLGMMVNPWVILAGAAAGVAVAYNQGAAESQRFDDALILTGHTADVSAGQLEDMAARIDKVTGTTSQAADALAQLVESGQQGGQTLEAMGRAAVAMNEATGKAISTTVAEFAKLRGDPLKAVEELNNKYHFLTAAIYEQVKALSERGDKDAATEVAQQALAAALETRARAIVQNLGTIETAWKGIRKFAAEAWDAMLGVGREESLDERLKAAEARLKAQQERNANLGIRDGLATQQLGAEVAALAGAKYAQEANARAMAQTQEREDARIQLDKERDKYLSGRAKLEKEHADNVARLNTQLDKAGASDNERNKLMAQENARFQKELNSLPNQPLQAAKAKAELTAAQLQQNLQLLQASITSGDAIVTYALEKGQVTIEAAYQARLGMIQTESQAQREALQRERLELEKELKLAAKPDERDAARKRIVEVDTKIKLLDGSLTEATRKLGIWKTEQERSLATITAKIRVDVAGITGQFDRQAIQDQLKLQFQGDYEAAGRIGDPKEAAAARERIDLLVAAGAAQAEFNAKLAEAQRLQQAQAAIEAAIQQRVSTGQISQIEGEAKIQQARAAQVPLLQNIVDGLERIKGAMPTDAAVAIDQMTTSIAEMRNTVASSTPVIVDWGTKAKNTAIDGLADAAANAVTQFSSLRDMVSGTLKNIAADLVRSDIKRLLMNLFKMDGGGGGGGGGGSFLGAIWSGARSLFGFAEGGQIRGPGTGTSDSVPALVDGVMPIAVSNEEFIQPVKAVKHYGTGFMEAVRTLRLPKPSTGYALGGLVQASQRARFATGGAVAAAAAGAGNGAMPNVVLQFTNTGTPQKPVRQTSSFEGKDLVVRVLLADAQAGGPITQALGPALGRN